MRPMETIHIVRLNEGLGKVLRFGAYNKEVIDRLKWMERVLGPLLKEALELHGPMDLKTLIAQMLQMEMRDIIEINQVQECL